MGCWVRCGVHGVLGALCAVCGVWGAGVKEGTQQHGVALPPRGDAGGHSTVAGLMGHQPAARMDGEHRANRSPRHNGGRWLFGDSHRSRTGQLARTRHPRPQLMAQPWHPPPCLPYEVAPGTAPGQAPSLPQKPDANTDQVQQRSRTNTRHQPEWLSPSHDSKNTLPDCTLAHGCHQSILTPYMRRRWWQ